MSSTGSSAPSTPVTSTTTSQLSLQEAVTDGIGGVRGIAESALPPTVFIIVNLIWELRIAVWAALGVALAIAAWRLMRRDTVRHAVTGAVGVAIAAMIAAKTGRAQDFFLPGIITNFVYGTAFAVSAFIRRPLVGYAWALVTGANRNWREEVSLVRAFAMLSWLWAGMFALRGGIQLWFYLSEYTLALGIARILGIAPYAAALAFTVWYGRRVTGKSPSSRPPHSTAEIPT